MDDDYNTLYHAERKPGQVMNLFAAVAIILSCLGLLGLSSYVVRQRIKEIGIRKILGASVFSILTLISGNFAKLILAAIVVATPAALYITRQWLEGFAYRINLQWWMFVVSGVAAIVVALTTISFESIKAALMNPVKSLKTE